MKFKNSTTYTKFAKKLLKLVKKEMKRRGLWNDYKEYEDEGFLSYHCPVDIIDMMEELGFRVKTSSRNAWIHKEYGIVIKTPFLSDDDLKYMPSRAVPTVIIYDKDFGNSNYPIFIQPLVKTDSESVEKALNILDKFEENEDYDIHGGNCGMYGNKAVLFDW